MVGFELTRTEHKRTRQAAGQRVGVSVSVLPTRASDLTVKETAFL